MSSVPQQKDLLTKRWRVARMRPTKEVTALHIPLVAMLKWALKDGVLMRHYPSGEHRDDRTAAKLKAMGTVAGCADLEFMWRDAEGHLRVLFLELKLPGRKQTAAQIAFMQRVRAFGQYYVADTIDQALAVIARNGLIKPGVNITPMFTRRTGS